MLPEEVHAADALATYVSGSEESGRFASMTRSAVILPGGTGFKKDTALEPTNPITVGGTTYMWFNGINNTTNQYNLGLATSTDEGLTWSEHSTSTQVLGNGVSFAGNANGACAIPFTSGTFLVFFVSGYGAGTEMYRVQFASDGVTVLAGPTQCIAANAAAWFTGTSNPGIYVDAAAGKLRMVFSPWITDAGAPLVDPGSALTRNPLTTA